MTKKHFYEVTMTETVTRRVAADSPEEAIERVDKVEMVHELTSQGRTAILSAARIPGVPGETDDMDEIAEEILEYNHAGMHELRPLYQKIVALNKKRVAAGLDEYEPPAFNELTDEFMARLRQTSN